MSQTVTAKNPDERAAHSYPGSLYLLPSDEDERQRLLAQHELYTRLLSGRLILAPLSISGKDQVLDIGTGGGAWLYDVHKRVPESVQFYGIDIESRLFPSGLDLSDNLHFSICSGTDLPSHWTSKFALVHQRLLIAAYTLDQWKCNIDEMYRVLTPGGYVQLIEAGPEWHSGPKTARHMLFLDAFLESKGMSMRCGIYLTDMLKAAGFVDVRSEVKVLNMGKWAGEDGVRGANATMGAWRGIRGAVMRAGGFGRFATAEEFDRALDGVLEEWDNIEGSHAQVRVFFGRKPN